MELLKDGIYAAAYVAGTCSVNISGILGNVNDPAPRRERGCPWIKKGQN
jgi:hypothetical protein